MHALVPVWWVIAKVIVLQKELQIVHIIGNVWRSFMIFLLICLRWFLQIGAKNGLMPEIIVIVNGQKIQHEQQISALAKRKIVKMLANDPKAVLAEHFFLDIAVKLIGEFLP